MPVDGTTLVALLGDSSTLAAGWHIGCQWGGWWEGWVAPTIGLPVAGTRYVGHGCVCSHFSPFVVHLCVAATPAKLKADMGCGFVGCGHPFVLKLVALLVLGVSECRAATRAAGGVSFVGGTCVTGAGGQPLPRGWLAKLGCNGRI